MTARLISGDRVLAPEAFDADVARAAASLAAWGVSVGDVVALLLRNDFAFFIASLAARRIGAVVTPINWHATGSEIGYVLSDSGARVLIGHDELLLPLPALGAQVRMVSVPTPPEIAAAYGLAPARPPAGAVHWEDWLRAATSEPPASVERPPPTMIYTSGTTGRPKGVRRSSANPLQVAALQAMFAAGYGLAPQDGMVVLMTGPMYHSAPNSYGLAAAATAETVVLQPRFDAGELLAQVRQHRVTHMHMVPTMFVRLLKLPEMARAASDPSSLRFVVHGAAPCPVAVKRRMIEWWGPVIHEYYGSTETGLITSHGSADALRKPGTVGRALPGVSLRVLGDDGAELARGGIGEVFVRSETMPPFTYHGREDEREAVECAGYVTVGDIGWLDGEGFLFLCDRRRHMIISGGVNIYPAEIEAELLALPGVRDGAVFGIPDEEFGEAVCAHIELEPGATMSASAVRAALATRLSRFKLPKVVEFAASLPREDSGKIFKQRLRDPYWAHTGRAI